MGVFSKSRVKIRREKQDGINRVYVDYNRVKDRNHYRDKLLKDFLGDNSALVVIDTKLTYQRQVIPEMIDKVIRILEENEVIYRKVVTESDYTPSFFGFAMKTSHQKAVDYVIGFLIPSELTNMIEALDSTNAYYHILSKDTDPQVILDKFSEAQGNVEKLKDGIDFSLYHDNNFSIISVFHKDDKTEWIENILNSH